MRNDSSEGWERVAKLQATVGKLLIDKKRHLKDLISILQDFVDNPKWVVRSDRGAKFDLYFFGKQKIGGWERGRDVEAHLYETGRIKFCLSKDDEAVKSWISHPGTYPEEFREKAIFLWKSIENLHGRRGVACLYWVDGRVVVDWLSLENYFECNRPALLRPQE
jgi:hypothetical protein